MTNIFRNKWLQISVYRHIVLSCSIWEESGMEILDMVRNELHTEVFWSILKHSETFWQKRKMPQRFFELSLDVILRQNHTMWSQVNGCAISFYGCMRWNDLCIRLGNNLAAIKKKRNCQIRSGLEGTFSSTDSLLFALSLLTCGLLLFILVISSPSHYHHLQWRCSSIRWQVMFSSIQSSGSYKHQAYKYPQERWTFLGMRDLHVLYTVSWYPCPELILLHFLAFLLKASHHYFITAQQSNNDGQSQKKDRIRS